MVDNFDVSLSLSELAAAPSALAVRASWRWCCSVRFESCCLSETDPRDGYILHSIKYVYTSRNLRATLTGMVVTSIPASAPMDARAAAESLARVSPAPAAASAAAAAAKAQEFAHRIVEFADFDACCKFFREKAVDFDTPTDAGWSLLMRICACGASQPSAALADCGRPHVSSDMPTRVATLGFWHDRTSGLGGVRSGRDLHCLVRHGAEPNERAALSGHVEQRKYCRDHTSHCHLDPKVG